MDCSTHSVGMATIDARISDVQMIDWSVEITKVDNGYVITYSDIESTRIEVAENLAIEKEFYREAECLARVFRSVQEYFGVFNSKHNDHRLEIKVEMQKQ